ncbi:FAD-binding oxidoreductase [Endozoicomonas sp.]|uniref:FAD-binding oxidoreductase n=1 Tax=Endozoicomonas sp. TaxID=1892382 RepID=UPI00288797C4|nr:FAD-binding oxidoreductase [Endozoicomonas sp.]
MTVDNNGYEQAREIWNKAVPAKPGLIVECRTEEDVLRSIEFADRHDLAFSLRSGGHNIAGRGLLHNGMTLNLRHLNKMEVDHNFCRLHVGPGAILGDIDRLTSAHDLAVPLGVEPTTGAVGLTLGGGMGRLSCQYGLSCDSLVSARMVLANGQVIDVSENHYPEIFWAIRGGGGNFGVVTEMTFTLHPIPRTFIHGGIVYGKEKVIPALQIYREILKQGDRKLGLDAALIVDHQGQKSILFNVCFNGTRAEAEDSLRVLDSLGKPLSRRLIDKTYPEVQSSEHMPFGFYNYYQSSMTNALQDELIEILAEALNVVPVPDSEKSEFFIAFQQMGTAISDQLPEATAFAHRDALCNIIPISHTRSMTWHQKTKQCIDLIQEQIAPYCSGFYTNDCNDTNCQNGEAFFHTNLPRLKLIKQQYDPDNLFNRSVDISGCHQGLAAGR